MHSIATSALAATFLAASALAASATSVTLTDSITQQGDVLTYGFTGLPTLAAGDGRLTLATTGTNFNGVDLGNETGEYMDVDADGLPLGRWECDIANDGGQLIPGSFHNTDCLFSLLIDIPALDFAGMIADGSVTVSLFMGPEVSFFSGENDEIAVTLEYTAAAVPLPATLPLLAAGLGGLALIQRRRRT